MRGCISISLLCLALPALRYNSLFAGYSQSIVFEPLNKPTTRHAAFRPQSDCDLRPGGNVYVEYHAGLYGFG